mmetsp:Transcript_5293/g.15941  ORF Transcript_5293/g.15941 Transcript_5293/m.15941 type:complete len:208 (+) Transcript_5293:3577-4200(+)
MPAAFSSIASPLSLASGAPAFPPHENKTVELAFFFWLDFPLLAPAEVAWEHRILFPFGRMIAYCCRRLTAFVSSFLQLRSKSFRLTGSCLKRSETFTVVPLPLAQVDSSTPRPSPLKVRTVARPLPPPSTTLSSALVAISTDPTVERDAKASPRKPNVATLPSYTSVGSLNLDVVCLRQRRIPPSSSKRSALLMPHPSSLTSTHVSP